MLVTYVRVILALFLCSASVNLNVLFSQAAETGANQPAALDTGSVNNIDGYLSYTGWYRPKKIHYGGTEWKDNQNDWRPLLMYTWPNDDVAIEYLEYFLKNGFQSSANQLTVKKVEEMKALPEKAKKATLKNYVAVMRDNIEADLKKNNNNNQNLVNTLNSFIAQNDFLSTKSERSVQYSKKDKYKPDPSGTTDDDQIIFGSSSNTPLTSSKYRKLNRTTTNQTNEFDPSNVNGLSPEFLVGNDIDNSNPIVQAETLNWEYFLLNYGTITANEPKANFDGFRVDAADNYDADLLDQLSQLMDEMYGLKGNSQALNDHLTYSESYQSSNGDRMRNVGSPQLIMDGGYFYTLNNQLGYGDSKNSNWQLPKLNTLATNSYVNRTNDNPANTALPNWSFVNNHDQQKNRINQAMIDLNPNDPTILADGYTPEKEKAAIKVFQDNKNYYQTINLPAQYALLLTNKDTVPTVYYGDMYDEFSPYMSKRTENYEAIETLLKARKKYVAGPQSTSNQNNETLFASVREGKDRNSGIAVIVTNGEYGKSETEKVSLGQQHANQEYVRILGNDGDTVTTSQETVTTNGNGEATFPVNETASFAAANKKPSNPNMVGHLGVWVPKDAPANQDVRTQPSEVTEPADGKIYHSNAAIDSHVIYEAFSLYLPDEKNMYQTIGDRADELAGLGLTDIWMPPAYRSFNMTRYGEGYSIADRYDLGENTPTKYGTDIELRGALVKMHDQNLKVQMDLVPNQVLGMGQQEAVTVYRGDRFGRNFNQSDTLQKYLDQDIAGEFIYFPYTKGGGDKQKQYGGEFLADLQQNYPSLFNTPAKSTGEAPDPSVKIKQWQAKYQNGSSLQNLGINLAMKVNQNEYAYLKDGDNQVKETLLPEELRGDYEAGVRTGNHVFDGKVYRYDSKGILTTASPPTPPAKRETLYRLYNPNSGEHFYTLHSGEKEHLIKVGWNDEGFIGETPTTGEDVYRLYNPNAGDHHYTKSVIERDHLASVGWKAEGVAFKSGGPVDVLRVYNPNAVTGSHHYTQHESEKNQLVKLGWLDEGIGWNCY